eukprot:496467-Prymnesium_polylepis.1
MRSDEVRGGQMRSDEVRGGHRTRASHKRAPAEREGDGGAHACSRRSRGRWGRAEGGACG